MKFKKGILPTKYEDRLKYLYRLQELLRLYHNKKGKDFRDDKIDKKNFRHFQRTWFDKRNLLICKEINNCRKYIPEFEEEKDLPIDKQGKIGALYKLAKTDKNIVANIVDIEE